MVEEQRWCKNCGNTPDHCKCGTPKGYTINISKAYKIWLDYKNKNKEKK